MSDHVTRALVRNAKQRVDDARQALDLVETEELAAPRARPLSEVGLAMKEIRAYSLLRAINEFSNPNDPCHSGLAYECSQTISQALKRVPTTPYSFFVPYEFMTRDMTAGVAGQGGYLKDGRNASFIEMLRNAGVMLPGATILDGLVGDAPVPRQSNTATAAWLATEASTVTPSDQTFQQVMLTPKNVAAATRVSRQLVLQANPGAEAIVARDLSDSVGTAVDGAIINGSGASGQPLGIFNTPGVGSLTGAAFAFDDAIEAQSDLSGANALRPTATYVATPAVAALLQARPRMTSGSVPLWEGSQREGIMVGHRAVSTNQMPSATLLFGELSEVVVGEWGVLEIMTNPFAAFTSLKIDIRAAWTIDVAIRHAGSFTVATSVS